jgi:hypothetical protein
MTEPIWQALNETFNRLARVLEQHSVPQHRISCPVKGLNQAQSPRPRGSQAKSTARPRSTTRAV